MTKIKREAPLSQRGHAVLQVIENCAKSLKVVQNYTDEHVMRKSIVTMSLNF